MIELHNRELAEADGDMNFCDNYIKPQQLVGRYIVPLHIGIGMGISANEIEHPEVCKIRRRLMA